MSDTVCLLQWSVIGDAADITGFTITSEVVQGSTPATNVSLPGTARHYHLTDLQPSTEYTICITMSRDGQAVAGAYVCTSMWTNAAPEQSPEDEYHRLLAIILASIFAGAIFIAVVAIVFVLLRRYCVSKRKTAAAASNPAFASTRPQIGFSSKRFAKGRANAADKPRTVSAVSGNDQEQSLSSAFTPHERATILAMLAETRLPSSPNPRAFANQAYDPGSSDFNGHVYDAIPGEYFDDLPLDSPV